MRRIYHSFTTWEETPMWQRTPPREVEARTALARAIVTDPPRFRRALRRALTEWPLSVEHNLTDVSLNRAAWLWWAASYIETGCSEELTRGLWMTLTAAQRVEADRIAWEVVEEWCLSRIDQRRVCQSDLWESAS